ncbi:zinc-dependent alcohol dehydrogenase family protein [Massilia sp. TS11]|uniref:zinc-dependent alcohol dehydrogenase family protein n=1 Tax=Massilia sp. TS11 TaxID=2908003 RepID=UPI001EDBDD13|nr:zinc-dependent alcohol dehydrogenase family protein [Massilia sp. TS11]MCG2583973.1 zinc-dependent alcohol dehydrogenase family protein [Massilia sp. TS11]
MLAMQLGAPGQPLMAAELPIPQPGPGQLLLRVLACGVCRTDLHIVDGELAPHRSPLIPGHEIVGEVVALGAGVQRFALGARVGVAWLGDSCGHCPFCAAAQENLCDDARFTGYDCDGGYAEYTLARADYCFALPAAYDDAHAAPLLCAGLIGYRAYRMAGPAAVLGLYGFGAAAHILAQVALAEGRTVYAFTRPGDTQSQAFARQLGVHWAGPSDAAPPQTLDAAILFAPDGTLVPRALAQVRKGGSVICAGIHMSDIPAFPYHLLWGERRLQSVANLTRADGEGFMQVAASVPLQTHVRPYPLRAANQALDDVRAGRIDGAAVLIP